MQISGEILKEMVYGNKIKLMWPFESVSPLIVAVDQRAKGYVFMNNSVQSAGPNVYSCYSLKLVY